MPYEPEDRFQPVCAGTDECGELIWNKVRKEPWHTRMFPVHYTGDLGENWMWLSAYEKGMEWV